MKVLGDKALDELRAWWLDDRPTDDDPVIEQAVTDVGLLLSTVAFYKKQSGYFAEQFMRYGEHQATCPAKGRGRGCTCGFATVFTNQPESDGD